MISFWFWVPASSAKIAGNHRNMEGINTEVAHQKLVSFGNVIKTYCDAKSKYRYT